MRALKAAILGGLCVVNAVLAGIVYAITRYPRFWISGFLVAFLLLTALYLWIERINPMWSQTK